MAFFMWCLTAFGNFSCWVLGLLLGTISAESGAEFKKLYAIGQKERDALAQAEREAVAKLAAGDQALLPFSTGHLTQARAAKRRYWKVVDPVAYARYYKAMDYDAAALQHAMQQREKMPGYFQKKVYAALQNL